MTQTEVKVIGALLAVVFAVLLILSFGFAFSGEENTRSSFIVKKHVPYVFVNGLFDKQIVASQDIHTNTCGHFDTFITYHEQSSPQRVMYVDGFYYEPSCNCQKPLTFIAQQSFVPTPEPLSGAHVNYVPRCDSSVQTFIAQRSSEDVRVHTELQGFYFKNGCN